MTDYGILSTGFRRKPEDVIKTEIQDDLRSTLSSKINLDKPRSKLANVLRPPIRSLGELWEIAEWCYNAIDPDNNTGDATEQLAAQQGVYNLGVRQGVALVTLELEPGEYAAGSIVLNVEGDPSNTWKNTYALSISTPDDYVVQFKSDVYGPLATATAGSLVLTSPVDGVLSVDLEEDATPGQPEETQEELEARRKASLAKRGSGTQAAIRDAVLEVPGVEQVVVFTNRKSEPEDGIPAHSHRVVIYDGDPAQANDDAVAQAIFSEQTDGIRSWGEIAGNTTDANGRADLEYFDRATTRQLAAEIHIESASGVDVTGIKEAMSDYVTGIIGGRLVLSKLQSLVLDQDGVDDIEDGGDLEIDGDDLNVQAEQDERLALDVGDIDLYVNGVLA